jgi:hypothetical protein
MESTSGALELEVVEIERRGKPGCGTSSTHPRCTCPIESIDEDGE